MGKYLMIFLGLAIIMPNLVSASNNGENVIDSSGTVYLLSDDGYRKPYTSAGTFLSYGYSFSSIKSATADDLARPIGVFVIPKEGSIFCSDRGNDKSTCYLIRNGKKAGFTSAAAFYAMGFSFNRAIYGDISFLQSDTPISLSSISVDLTKLPLGDNKYSTSPKKGYIYSCQTQFNGGGAFTQGPWIDSSSGTWDLTKKAIVDGSVSWPNVKWSLSSDGTTRTASGNGLPNHKTGTFPIQTTDDAYSYDRNPNSIKENTISISFPANPTKLSTPECAGGTVGIMLSGVPLFNGFDAGGRDAVATEIQDKCDGHPQESGQYHYHGLSDCITDTMDANGQSGLMGYALDGYGIFGSKGPGGVELSSNDLDECHGITSEIDWDGKRVNMYHYVLTHDFPYSVGCFRAHKVAQVIGQAFGGSNQQPIMGGYGQILPPPR